MKIEPEIQPRRVTYPALASLAASLFLPACGQAEKQALGGVIYPTEHQMQGKELPPQPLPGKKKAPETPPSTQAQKEGQPQQGIGDKRRPPRRLGGVKVKAPVAPPPTQQE